MAQGHKDHRETKERTRVEMREEEGKEAGNGRREQAVKVAHRPQDWERDEAGRGMRLYLGTLARGPAELAHTLPLCLALPPVCPGQGFPGPRLRVPSCGAGKLVAAQVQGHQHLILPPTKVKA